MHLATYTTRRLKAACSFPYQQRTPYSGPVEYLRIPTADGVEIGAVLLARGHPDLLIICHGVCCNQRSLSIVWLAEALLGPWDVLTFDWRGYPASGGQASFGGDEMFDLMAVLQQARRKGYRHIGIIADSMGGLICLSVLGTAAASGLQGWETTPYPDRIATLAAPADYALAGWPRPWLMKHLVPYSWARPLAPLFGFRLGTIKPLCSLDAIAHINVPLLLIHGTRDRTVPVQNVYLLQEQAPRATIHIYTGVGHGVDAMRLQAPQRLLKDLREHFSAM